MSKQNSTEMSIEEAVERCNELIKKEHECWIGITNQKAIETVLNMLKEQKDTILQQEFVINECTTELEKKDKIINKAINEKCRELEWIE